MADFQHEHDYFFILDVTDQAIVGHPIPPQTTFLAVQWLAPLPGIFSRKQSFAQESLDYFLGGPAQFCNLLFSCPRNLNPPILLRGALGGLHGLRPSRRSNSSRVMVGSRRSSAAIPFR